MPQPTTYTIYAIHAPSDERLGAVVAEMRIRGAPTIHVVDCGEYYQALEGSHRIAAAHELRLLPKLVVYHPDGLIDISGFDWFDAANWAETVYPAGEVASELFSPTQAVPYSFAFNEA